MTYDEYTQGERCDMCGKAALPGGGCCEAAERAYMRANLELEVACLENGDERVAMADGLARSMLAARERAGRARRAS